MGYIFFKKSRATGAVRAGRKEDLQKLLDKGLDPNSGGTNYYPLLMTAVRNGNADAVSLLLEYGAAPEKTLDSFYGSALHEACQRGSVVIAQMLLQASGGLLAIKDRNGNTPLHVAAGHGHDEVVKLLLAHGADPFAKNNEYRIPSFLSDQKGFRRASEPLLEAEQKVREVSPEKAPEPYREERSVTDENVWRKLSNDRIAQVTNEKTLGLQLTDIFNFSSNQCIRIVERVKEFGAREQIPLSHETIFFEALQGRGILEEAFSELEKRGTTLKREDIHYLKTPKPAVPLPRVR